jgi:hypothetical protein
VPNWQPKWEDVAWDHAAAEALSAELNRKADLLESSITRRTHVANYAAAEWQGPKRLLFDAYRETVMTRAQDLANAYREMAERIGKASGAATSASRSRLFRVTSYEPLATSYRASVERMRWLQVPAPRPCMSMPRSPRRSTAS